MAPRGFPNRNWGFPKNSASIVLIDGMNDKLDDMNEGFRMGISLRRLFTDRLGYSNVHTIVAREEDNVDAFMQKLHHLFNVHPDRSEELLVYVMAHGNEERLKFVFKDRQQCRIPLLTLMLLKTTPVDDLLFIVEACNISDATIELCSSKSAAVIVARDRLNAAVAGAFRLKFIEHLWDGKKEPFEAGRAACSKRMPGVYFGNYWWDLDRLARPGSQGGSSRGGARYEL